MLAEGFQIGTHHQAQFFFGGQILGPHLAHPLGDQFQGAIKQLQQNLLLAPKMMVKTGFLQADRLSNICHRSAVKALLADNLCCGFEDGFSGHQNSLPTVR